MSKVSFFNAQGLNGKDKEIQNFLDEQENDICFIVETWLSPEASAILRAPFLNITKPRIINVRPQGGILGYCRNSSIEHHIRVISQTEDYAFMMIADQLFGVGYFPPSANFKILENFFETAQLLCEAEDVSCILIGDFNARMGGFSRDSSTNTRGRQLMELVQKYPFILQKPVVGKYTTRTHNGQGITDLVFTNEVDIQDYTVHENKSLGGSDHRPITFTIPNLVLTEKFFKRWHVRKLAKFETQNKYIIELGRNKENINAELYEISDQRTSSAELAWEVVKKWIEDAAMKSCGLFTYNSKETNKNFWTDELC